MTVLEASMRHGKRRFIGPLLFALCATGSLAACGEDALPPPAPRNPPAGGGGANDEGGDGDGDGTGPMATTLAACGSEANPAQIPAPAADFEHGSFRFELRSGTLRSIEGTALDATRVRDPNVIDLAVLIGTGAFLENGCIARQQGTSFSWEGVACQASDGELFNTFVVEPDSLAGMSGRVKVGATLRVSGYEIERFNDFSPGGGYWQDGGDVLRWWAGDIAKRTLDGHQRLAGTLQYHRAHGLHAHTLRTQGATGHS